MIVFKRIKQTKHKYNVYIQHECLNSCFWAIIRSYEKWTSCVKKLTWIKWLFLVILKVRSEVLFANYYKLVLFLCLIYKSIVCEGVPTPPSPFFFKGTHLLTRLAPFLKSFFPLPSFLCHSLVRYLRKFTPPSCKPSTNWGIWQIYHWLAVLSIWNSYSQPGIWEFLSFYCLVFKKSHTCLF